MMTTSDNARRGQRRRFRFARLVLIQLIVLLSASPVRAQELADTEFSSPQAIAQRLEAVRAELGAIGAGGDPAARELLLQLEAALYQHREAVDYLAEMNRAAEAAREALHAWSGLERAAPYSIDFSDQLRSEQQSRERQLRAAKARLRIVNRAIEDSTGRLSEHQRVARQLSEELDAAGTIELRREAQHAAQREELASRLLVETLARLQLRRNSQQVQIEALEAALELTGLKIGAARGKVQFTRPELDAIQSRIAQERSAILAAALPDSGGVRDKSSQLTWKIDILDIERDFWTALYAAMNAEQAAVRKTALASIRSLKSRADDWVELISMQLRDMANEETPAIGARASQEDVRRVVKLQNQLEFALAELGDEGLRGPGVLDRLADAWHAFVDVELYLAEETASIGGQKVSTYRAVTLGKVLRLALILTVGWFVLRFLSRRVHALVKRRPNVAPGIAETARGWTFGIGLALLVLYGLNRVHIPFTAFAFLGGTLAIGIGFGAQTLLKNFISGIILSLERPFKVGDMLQVDELLGTVHRIGMRASVIHHFDGTDTLVPNSALLENRVSNWTYGDASMRAQIDVGVAYGSPTREVSRALLAVAGEHGLVLDKPAPEVRFEQFGDNALLFSLLFWFDASRTARGQLASDLRFMVDKALTEAGIVMAFPQRDIHFDDSKPLRIELSRAAQAPMIKPEPD
jgi:small-conductance mechanosensitive channel